MNVNSALFVICLSYFDSTKRFVSMLFKIDANQRSPDLNRGVSSNLCCLRISNHVKFIQECVMYMQKHVFIKRMLTNDLNMGLSQRTWVKKTVCDGETH